MKTYCTKDEALKSLEAMNDKEFNIFLKKCPNRVQLLVRGRMVDWREVLPDYYIKLPF